MKSIVLWRKGWDSNPRCPCGHAGFQDRCLQPLGHPSGTSKTIKLPDRATRENPGFAILFAETPRTDRTRALRCDPVYGGAQDPRQPRWQLGRLACVLISRRGSSRDRSSLSRLIDQWRPSWELSGFGTCICPREKAAATSAKSFHDLASAKNASRQSVNIADAIFWGAAAPQPLRPYVKAKASRLEHRSARPAAVSAKKLSETRS